MRSAMQIAQEQDFNLYKLPSEQLEESHFVGIGLRTPTDSGLRGVCQEILSNKISHLQQLKN